MKALILSALILSAVGAPPSTEQSPPSAQQTSLKGRNHTLSRPGGPLSVPSMTGWNVNVVDAVEMGGAWSVKIIGDRAYVGFYGLLSILDVTNPSAPVRLGFTLLNGGCVKIEAKDDYLLCITQEYPANSLQIVNVVDPTNPLVVQTVPIQGEAMDVEGDYLYLQHGDDVRIYDISSVESPQLAGSFGSYRVSDIVADGERIYVGRNVSPSSGLQILDASNPILPVQMSLLATGAGGYKVAAAGTHVLVSSFFSPSGLYSVDASNPSAPVVIDVEPAYTTTDLLIEGDYAYLSDSYGRLRILDIQNPGNLVQKSLFTPCSSFLFNGIDVENGLAAIESDGLCLVDVSNPTSPYSVGHFQSLPTADNLDIIGSHLAVSLNDGSLASVNRYDRRLRYFADTAGYFIDGSRIAVRDNYAYVSICDSWGYWEDDGLEVFDLTEPTNPIRVGFLPSTWCPRGVTAGENHVYFAPYGSLWVVDVSNPSAPAKVGELPGYVRDQFAVEPYVFCVTSGGLTVVDVSNPSVPSVVGNVSLSGDLETVWVSGSHAYVASLRNLWVVDISDPIHPALVGSFPTNSARGVRVRDQYAYVSDNDRLRIVDVSSPSTPVEVGNIELGWLYARVAVAPPYIYALSASLLVLETPLMTNAPEAPLRALSLKQNYPNPFNPSTTIAFDTPVSGHVRLDVFDVRGRFVRRLIDESMPAGAHSITWDGRDSGGNAARSGVYFYRLEADGKTDAKKMVILK